MAQRDPGEKAGVVPDESKSFNLLGIHVADFTQLHPLLVLGRVGCRMTRIKRHIRGIPVIAEVEFKPKPVAQRNETMKSLKVADCPWCDECQQDRCPEQGR